MSAQGPDAAALRVRLLEGLPAGEEVRTVAAALGLGEGATEAQVGRALVGQVARDCLARVQVEKERRTDPRPVDPLERVAGADTSFLGKLRVGGAGKGGPEVSGLDDARTLLGVARAGTLRQRRAAVTRLGELVNDDRAGISGDDRKRVAEVLGRLRDVELAYELSGARAQLSGSAGREAREDREHFDRLAATVARRVGEYWDGDGEQEPITQLPGDQRALLLMRVRDLPGPVVDHIAAVFESTESLARDDRLGLLASLRFAGDPRLVPSLIAVVEGGDAELAVEAARALGRIDDPRVHAALLGAYERNVVNRQRTVLAGALGHAGDARGAPYVRQSLDNDDVETRRAALEALEAVGGAEDSDLLVRRLGSGDSSMVLQTVRTLARIADGRALEALGALREQTSVSALWAELEDAVAAIRARMELKGEEPGELAVAARPSDGEGSLVLATPAGVRVRAWKEYMVGQLWLALGGAERAVRRFELAASVRTGWCPPLLATAMVHVRKGRHAQALASFRLALEADRARVERNPSAARALAQSFLRRAEEVLRDGRRDVALGLLAEALSLDLRRAPSALRFEVGRRHEELRRRAG